ncbi:MAG TPA: hypothetical protein VF530_13165 [Planctomycetota bacterium]
MARPARADRPSRRGALARNAGLLVALALAVLPAAARAQGRCRPALELGINPSFQTWSSRAIVFADAFQRVREMVHWNGAPQGSAPLIPLGSGRLGAGWPDPAQLAPGARYGALLFGSMEGTVPDGRTTPYVVTWKGTGHVRLEGPFVLGEGARAAQRVEVLVDPTRGGGNGLLSVSWTAPDAADPVRDVHVWLPGMEGTGQVFWPPFLRRVRATSAGQGPSIWRTLDWTRVNEYGRAVARGGFVFDLVGVITPASASQGTPRGVAPEYQVALCNELGTDLHFQLPHRTGALSEADYLAFVTRTLTVIRDGSPGVPGVLGGRPFAGLRPDLTVTLELSNEIWNSGFPVNAWMNAEATRRGIPFAQQVAREIQLVFDVARTVFAGPDAARLRTYVGGFAADPGYLRRVLGFLRPGTRLDALGPAAYLGPRRPELDAWAITPPGVDELLATAERAVEVLRPQVAAHRSLAQGWTNPDGSNPNLELYEIGLNLKSIGQPWAAAARAVQTDARLFPILADRFLPMLAEEGVAQAAWYSFMTDQDSTLVEAYGMWNDMNQLVTTPVTRPYRDEGAPKAALLLLGPPPASTCPAASVTVRDAPGNPSTLRASPARLGTLLRLEVDLSARPGTAAFVLFSLKPASVPLSTGQRLLVSIDEAETWATRPGPLAVWSEPVPNDMRLAGIPLHFQAVELGGPTPSFTNALELVPGR